MPCSPPKCFWSQEVFWPATQLPEETVTQHHPHHNNDDKNDAHDSNPHHLSCLKSPYWLLWHWSHTCCCWPEENLDLDWKCFFFLFCNENMNKTVVAALRGKIQSSRVRKSKYTQKQTRLETEIVAAGVICTRLNTTRLNDSTKKFMNISKISIQIASIFDKSVWRCSTAFSLL